MRRITRLAIALGFALIGASFTWTALYYAWLAFLPHKEPVGDAASTYIPIPLLGHVAFYYLMHLGLFPAIVLLGVLGLAALVLAYVLFRRVR